MYVTLGRAEPIAPVTTETPGPVRPFPLERVNDTKTREFGAICRIFTKVEGGHSIGSGVLITPRHVLTCAHVIRPQQNPDMVMSITVFVAPNGPADTKNGIKADGWAVKPGWSPRCCRSDDDDLGIIRLSKPVTTGVWPIVPFDPRRLVTKAGYLAGYRAVQADPEAHYMYRSRGVIKGSMSINWCQGKQLLWPNWPSIDQRTRLVWHELDTDPVMSGGPMWSFFDKQRVLWGLHAGDIDGKNKKAILLSQKVVVQIREWVSKGLPRLPGRL